MGDGAAQGTDGQHRRRRVLLQSAQALAARLQRLGAAPMNPQRWRKVVIVASLAATIAFVWANAVGQQDDAFLMTAAGHEERSRETAKRLFEFVERQFDSYKDAKPIEVTVLEEVWEDGRPPSFIHQAKFALFEAAYYLVAGGSRTLASLTTRSAAFKLPAGIKMGQTKNQVLHALGPPTAISKNALLYQLGGEATHEVFFTFDQDHLVKVSWTYGAAA